MAEYPVELVGAPPRHLSLPIVKTVGHQKRPPIPAKCIEAAHRETQALSAGHHMIEDIAKWHIFIALFIRHHHFAIDPASLAKICMLCRVGDRDAGQQLRNSGIDGSIEGFVAPYFAGFFGFSLQRRFDPVPQARSCDAHVNRRIGQRLVLVGIADLNIAKDVDVPRQLRPHSDRVANDGCMSCRSRHEIQFFSCVMTRAIYNIAWTEKPILS